jgi:arylsulfatase A
MRTRSFSSCFGSLLNRHVWVLIDGPTGDDNGPRGEPAWFTNERGYAAHSQPGELFNIRNDVAQRHNEYTSQPEIVRELKELLQEMRGNGRSTPRRPQ